MRLSFFLITLALPFGAFAQGGGAQNVIAQGEKVFNQSCATGYCHGPKGAVGGAPRLVARGFDQAYINTTVTRGIQGTAMPAFAGSLSRGDVAAVVAYVATLNGIANPIANAGGGREGPPEPELSAEAKQGRALFEDAFRSFGRCATCHEVQGIGIQVATPIAKVPADAQALRNLASPDIRTAVIDGQSIATAVGNAGNKVATLPGETVPALVINQGKRRVVLYDLTSAPPVLRSEEPAMVKISDGSTWKHSSVISSYNDAELNSILTYLRAVTHQ